MTKFKKAVLGAAAAMALAAPMANAGLVNMGGVLIDPNFNELVPPLADFTGQHKFLQFYVDQGTSSAAITRTSVHPNAVPDLNQAEAANVVNSGDVLVGVGYIDVINGVTTPTFCANSNCRLEFVFGGFTVTSFYDADPGAGTAFTPLFSGGWINIYLDNSPPFVDSKYQLTEVNAIASNNLWLSLDARNLTTPNGNTTLNFSSGSFLNGAVEAVFDVVGGVAKGNFDTNTVNLPLLSVSGGDLTYSGNARFTSASAQYSEEGNGQFRGDTIPEPATLALLGLGLLGMGGLSASRKRAKA